MRALEKVPKGEWVHLTFFCQHDQPAEGGLRTEAWFRVYLNGKQVSEYGGFPSVGNRINMSTLDWVTNVWYVGLGEAYVVKENHFEGMLHRISVFKRALEVDEIQRLYRSGMKSFEAVE